jgi:hypothetical protein
MKKAIIKISALIISITVLFSSCATIVSKSTYPLSINTTPNNVKIIITDKKGKEIFLGTTPATVKLKAGAGFFARAEYQVKLSSPGYNDKIIPINFKIDGWYFGNLFIGGVLGMLIVDPATGAMWKIETDYLNETLYKTETVSQSNPEMRIIEIDKIPTNWKNHLVKIN